MISETAAVLARCYLISYGVECGEREKGTGFYFDFTYKRQRFVLSLLPNLGIDICDSIGIWLHIDLKYSDVDETNPAFDPEVFFKPLLTAIKTHK